MPLAKKEISLLPSDSDATSLSSRIIHWATSVGRFVIIFTELIVISAFLSRFILDRKNSDLDDVLRQQKAIIESTKEFEADYSLLQSKLATIRKLYQKQPEYQANLLSLSESVPPDIIFDSLQMSQNQSGEIQSDLSLVAYRETSIIEFITNLVLNPQIKSVDVNNIEKKPKDAKYLVAVTVIFKSNGQQSSN